MTALATLGSATSTSLTSRGRSTTTDLPTPSAMKREPWPLAEIVIGWGSLAATGGGMRSIESAAAAESDRMQAIKDRVIGCLFLHCITVVLATSVSWSLL